MSYQIRSTPYFRRMFNNSKKNGQLQRLREEYERIQEFNDRTIELKMRQVRLKRLFREIEEIKETSSPNSISSNGGNSSKSSSGPLQSKIAIRRRQSLVTSGPNFERNKYNQRLEALARAKELGKEISRRNAELAEAGAGGFFRNELRMTAKMQAVADARREAVERRERAAKRISYGNAQSKHNLQRQVLRRQKRLNGSHLMNPDEENSLLREEDRDTSSSFSGGQMAVPINSSCIRHADRLQQLGNYANSHFNNLHGMPVEPKLVSNGSPELDPSPRCEARFTASSTTIEFPDISIPDHVQDLDMNEGSDLEIQAASLAPTTECTDKFTSFPDPLTLCCKETHILRQDAETDGEANVSEEGLTLSTTIAAYQPPLAVPRRIHQDLASVRWHQISLTLPWFKAFQNRRSVIPNGIPNIRPVAPTAVGSHPAASSYEDFSHNACPTSAHLGSPRFHDSNYWQATQRIRRNFTMPSEQGPTEQTEQSYNQAPQGYSLAQLRRAVFDQ